QAERFQYLEADAHFLFRLGRKRDANGVADARPQQHAHADARLDRAADQPAGLGDAEVQRAIDRLGELHVSGDREEHVARLHRYLVFVEIVVLQQLDVVERAFHQRLGAGLGVFLEQVLFEAAGVDPDADRAAVGLGRAHDFGDALARTDVARIDAQARRAGVGGFERALVVEVDIGDERHLRRAGDLAERGGAFDVGARDADDVGARFLAAANLVDRRACIGRARVGHRLYADRRVAA